MEKMIRYWNQNKRKIIIIIAIIAFILLLLNLVSMFLAQRQNERQEEEVIDKSKPVQSLITGEVVTEEITDQNTKIIEDFVNYCNNKQYEKAFSLLSEECKKEMNNNINIFITNYCNNVFKTQKTYTIDLWINSGNMYTYKITYYEDNLLATGNIDTNQNTEDYITIIKNGTEDRLSINRFVTEKEIGKSQEKNNIEIIINSKKNYINNEVYDITIRNRSQKTIMISEGKDGGDICLVDRNNVEYDSLLNEIPFESLSLKSGYEKNIRIRFNKMYDLYRTIDKIKFLNIILDAEKYIVNPNDETIEKMEMTIEI